MRQPLYSSKKAQLTHPPDCTNQFINLFIPILLIYINNFLI